MSTDYADQVLLETETDHELPGSSKLPVLPVCVDGRVITDEVTPQDAQTYTLIVSTAIKTDEGVGVAELLPHDELRVTARILAVDQDAVIAHSRAQANDAANIGAAAGTSQQTIDQTQAGTTSPGAAANISGTMPAASLPAGLYQVTVQAYLDGTLAAGTDDDNIRLVVSGGGINPRLMLPAVVGQISTTTFTLRLSGSQTLSVVTIGAGTVGSIYHAAIEATPISLDSPAVAVTFPNGAYLPKGIERSIRTTRRMWIAATNGVSNRISVIVERRQP